MHVTAISVRSRYRGTGTGRVKIRFRVRVKGRVRIRVRVRVPLLVERLVTFVALGTLVKGLECSSHVILNTILPVFKPIFPHAKPIFPVFQPIFPHAKPAVLYPNVFGCN